MDRRGDLVFAIVVVAYGAFVVAATAAQEPGPQFDPLGKQGMPYATGIVMMIAGAYLTLRRLRTWRAETSNTVYAEGAEDEDAYPASIVGPALVAGLLVAYAVSLPFAGYLISTPIFMAAGLWVLDRRQPFLLLVLPVGFTLIVFLVFSQLLSVPLPVGPLTDVLVDLNLIDRVR
jgi:putative tricarboxylic transport membrane protein